MTADLKKIFMDTAEENGWLADRDYNRDIEKAKRIAKKMLMRGHPVDEVTETTELPIETIMNL